jgi:hypothetical protein
MEELCPHCLEKGFEIELYESQNLNRCYRCIKSTLGELTGKEHYDLIQKEKDKRG